MGGGKEMKGMERGAGGGRDRWAVVREREWERGKPRQRIVSSSPQKFMAVLLGVWNFFMVAVLSEYMGDPRAAAILAANSLGFVAPMLPYLQVTSVPLLPYL